MQQAEYPLNEALIEYGSAMEDQDLIKAMDILDSLLMTAEVEAMWRQLHAAAIAAGDIRISQRCAAATGTIHTYTYIHGVVADNGVMRCGVCRGHGDAQVPE